MDSHSILDNDSGEGAHPAEALPPVEPVPRERPGTQNIPHPAQKDVRFPSEDGGKSLAEMAQRDLNATLQLLAERAQYITGATGAAIALRDSEEMVCRASAGSSAPEVGAQLQINSGLSGESVRTRQTLRCDDANTDERVNRESCEALGIRSVVVMPLLRGEEVLGVFELFSNKANVFEARDIVALERMGTMVQAALDQSPASLGLASPIETPQPAQFPEDHGNQAVQNLAGDTGPGPIPARAGDANPKLAEASAVAPVHQPAVSTESTASRGIAFHMKMPAGAAAAAARAMEESAVASPAPVNELAANDEPDILEVPPEPEIANLPNLPTSGLIQEEDILSDEHGSTVPVANTPGPVLEVAISQAPAVRAPETPASASAPVPASRGAVANLRKCEACGFPVSEGRQLCLDCEKKRGREATLAAKAGASVPSTPSPTAVSAANDPAPAAIVDEMPRFLAGEAEQASWLARHKFLVVTIALAVVAIAGAYLLC